MFPISVVLAHICGVTTILCIFTEDSEINFGWTILFSLHAKVDAQPRPHVPEPM
jgi:hypothetical protein